MTKPSRPTLESLLNRGLISEALDALERSAIAHGTREMPDKVAHVREAYDLLARYAIDGAHDPSRADVYADVCASIRDLAASLRRQRMMQDSATLYFSTVRTQQLQPDRTLTTVVDEYRRLIARKNEALITGETDPPVTEGSGVLLSTQTDMTEKELFNRLWTTHPLSREDADAIDALLDSPVLPSAAAQLTVAGIMAGEIEWHDDRRIVSLVKAYGSADMAVSVKAACALLISLWMHRRRPMRRMALDALAAAADSPRWAADMRMVFLQLIRARDTERVNRKINDEIMPDLMKMKPDMEKRLRDLPTAVDPMSLEDNPEWEEMIEKSGIRDRLKEISEMQEEGSDVMMGTFGTLKSFPFFNDIHHWFIPFEREHPSVARGDNGEWMAFADVIASASFLCDNDKYSLACAFGMMPADHRDMLLAQFKMQNLNMAEINASSLTTADTDREKMANRWIQSLYRFYKLFRRKGEFDDIFAEPVNPLEIPQLSVVFDDADTLGLASEFYFKRGYWDEAYTLFERLATLQPVTAQMLQKMGHCRQRTGDIAGALARYEHAELLDANSVWTLRRIGSCHRMAGNHEAALPYLERVAEACPEDHNAALALGHCLTALGRYREATVQYYKVDFIHPEGGKAVRPLAWALMMSGEFDKARIYYQRVLSDKPDATDYLNAAHLDLLTGRYADATDRYLLSAHASGGDSAVFTKAFEEDMPLLTSRGVDPLMARIVLDTVVSRHRHDSERQ